MCDSKMNSFSIKRGEWAFLGILILLYGMVAFYHLGDKNSPQTYYSITDSTSPVVFEVDEQPSAIALYTPVNDSSKYIGIHIDCSADGVTWYSSFDTNDDDGDYTAAMIWYHYPIKTNDTMKYYRISKHSSANRLVLSEVAFLDANDEVLPAKAMDSGAALLLDEPDTVNVKSTRMNSAYFDESYFPSSALELQDGLSVAEMDHPPVGRLIIGLGMDLFGRNPFGFRFMQVVTGILMLPLLYFLGRMLLKSPFWGAFATLLLALDFMHYTQTRIGTLDAFLVLFILGMYAFLYFYHISSTRVHRFAFLLLSGICTGLAVGTKWSGCYAACGLALLFFYWMMRDIRRSGSLIVRSYALECLWCVLCFVAIPVTIYCLSYIPYARTLGRTDLITTVVDHAKTMLSYHTSSSTQFNHPYSSKWWTWFLALKPVFYYYEAPPANVYLYATGNPLVWGFGALGILFALGRGIARDDDGGLLIAAAYLSQLIPWFFITRDTFLYHYFPMVPFLMLSVAYLFKNTCNHPPLGTLKKGYVGLFAAITLGSFIIAFPFIYGCAMTWNTILGVRLGLQVTAGVMLVLFLGLLIYNGVASGAIKKPSFSQKQKTMAEDEIPLNPPEGDKIQEKDWE